MFLQNSKIAVVTLAVLFLASACGPSHEMSSQASDQSSTLDPAVAKEIHNSASNMAEQRQANEREVVEEDRRGERIAPGDDGGMNERESDGRIEDVLAMTDEELRDFLIEKYNEDLEYLTSSGIRTGEHLANAIAIVSEIIQNLESDPVKAQEILDQFRKSYSEADHDYQPPTSRQ